MRASLMLGLMTAIALPLATAPSHQALATELRVAQAVGGPVVDYDVAPADVLAPTVDYDLTPKSAAQAPVVRYDVPSSAPAPATASVLAADRALAASLAERLKAEGFGKPATRKASNDGADRQALADHYAGDGAVLLWTRDGKLNARGQTLISTLKTADTWGLDSADFDVGAVEKALADGNAADAELALSLAALKYARYARGGRIIDPTKDLSSYLDQRPSLPEPHGVLAKLAASSDAGGYLTSLHPRHVSFRNLKTALNKLRNDTAEQDEIVQIPARGPLLSRGKTHKDVALLRERLDVPTLASDDGTAGNPEYFDDTLNAALIAFQKENGLTPDGLVGRQTRAAFGGGTRTVTEDMIIANMEMWRWKPEELGEDLHVIANIAELKVRVKQRGETIHEELIIVGKRNKQTPIFSDRMETIVFNPSWGVPNSIKVNELLPSLARGGTSFQRQNLRISYRGRDVDPRSIDWSRADIRNYHVYQPPGRGNVLGVVKFMFPNKHHVYMHDTPTKHLFKSKVRTYSHGCVRVRNPMRLAEVLLEADRAWPARRVASLVNGKGRENNVKLETGIPVHVVYQTVVADEAGNVDAFNDFYDHEKRIRLALAGQWSKVPRHRDHMLPVKINRKKIDAIARRHQQQQNPVNDIFQAIFGGF